MNQLDKYLPVGWSVNFYPLKGYYYLNIKNVLPYNTVAIRSTDKWEFKVHITEEFKTFVLEQLEAATNKLQEEFKNSQLEAMKNVKYK